MDVGVSQDDTIVAVAGLDDRLARVKRYVSRSTCYMLWISIHWMSIAANHYGLADYNLKNTRKPHLVVCVPTQAMPSTADSKEAFTRSFLTGTRAHFRLSEHLCLRRTGASGRLQILVHNTGLYTARIFGLVEELPQRSRVLHFLTLDCEDATLSGRKA